MRNITTGLARICPAIPSTGLWQNMLRINEPYRVEWMLEAATQPLVEPEVSSWLVLDTIRNLFPTEIDSVYKRANLSYPSFPEKKRIKYESSPALYMGAIDQDEGTIEGTYGVHEELFRDLAGFNEKQDHRFSKRLHLLVGDQKTTSFIRNQQVSQQEASDPFDRKQWLRSVPAPFHMEINYICTLKITHWPESSDVSFATQSTLEADRQYHNRTTQLYQKSPKFHYLQPFVLQMHNSRILALFLQELKVQHPHLVQEAFRGFSTNGASGEPDMTSKSDLSIPLAAVLEKLAPEQLKAVADGVTSKYLGSSAWMGQHSNQQDYIDPDIEDADFDPLFRACSRNNISAATNHSPSHMPSAVDQPPPAFAKNPLGRDVAFNVGGRLDGDALYNKANTTTNVDIEFRSHCRFLQEVQVYMNLSYAIKHGDIGHIRQLLPKLAILFYGAGQNNYGKEMLYFDWLLRPEVSDEVLSTAILTSTLAPTTSKEPTWKAIDREGEHYNLWLANDLRQGKNSTHNLDSVFFRDSFLTGYRLGIRRELTRQFGYSRSNKHTTRSTRTEIAERAQFLLRNGWLVQGHHSRKPNVGWDSLDILTKGRSIIGQKIEDFNETVPMDSDGWQSHWTETADEERWPLEPDARAALGEEFVSDNQGPGEHVADDVDDTFNPMTDVFVDDIDAIELEELIVAENDNEDS